MRLDELLNVCLIIQLHQITPWASKKRIKLLLWVLRQVEKSTIQSSSIISELNDPQQNL